MRKILPIVMALTLILALCNFAYADEKAAGIAENTPVIFMDDKNADDCYNAINKELEKNEGVIVVFDNKSKKDVIKQDNVEINSAAGTVICKVENKSAKTRWIGADYYVATGTPGITIGLSREEAIEKIYQFQISSSFGLPASTVINAFWGTSTGVKVIYSGTYKVPKTFNDKAVKDATLHMAPAYYSQSGTVYSKCIGYTDWIKKGEATSKQPYGVYLYKTFTYK